MNDAATITVADAAKHRRLAIGVVVTVGALLATSLIAYSYANRWPKRFAEVVPGRLYRSGEVTPAQLERLSAAYGIRRVVSLLNPDVSESVAERRAAEQLGMRWENVPLRGNGASSPADRARILSLLRDESAGPTLVHCAAGSNRTGLAIGLYRIEVEGWTYERALAELRQYDFEDGADHENLRAALREAAEAKSSASSE